MSDERLRELERAWRRTGAVEDAARWLAERRRVGDLDERGLRLLAYAGDAGALHLLADDQDERLAVLRESAAALAGEADPAATLVLPQAEEVVAFLACVQRGPRLVFPLRRGRNVVGRRGDHGEHEHHLGWSGRRVVLEAQQWQLLIRDGVATVFDDGSSNGSVSTPAAAAFDPRFVERRFLAGLRGELGGAPIGRRLASGTRLRPGDLLLSNYAAFVYGAWPWPRAAVAG